MCIEPAPMHCSTGFGKNAIPTVQCCSAKQGHSMHHIVAVIPVKICFSYRCAVSQHQFTEQQYDAVLNQSLYVSAVPYNVDDASLLLVPICCML